MKRTQLSICYAILSAAALEAQWLHQPTSGVPRLANGQPDWAAPVPQASNGHPDLSGQWRMAPNRYGSNLTEDLKPQEMQPWARAVHQERSSNLQSPYASCLPLGPMNTTGTVGNYMDGFKFVQTPNLILMLYVDLTYRQVFLDGRSLEKEPNPAWMGYSVGHWEGDTLVIQSNGYNSRTWLDLDGDPHSEGLRITERFHRRDFGHMDLNVTLEDPAVYSRPIRFDTVLQPVVDTEMMEYVCAENEKDRSHMTGKLGGYTEPSAGDLSKFVGSYSTPGGLGPFAIKSDVTLSGKELMMDTPLGRMPLRPIGKNMFSASGTVVRFFEENGVMTAVSSTVEGDIKQVRKP